MEQEIIEISFDYKGQKQMAEVRTAMPAENVNHKI